MKIQLVLIACASVLSFAAVADEQQRQFNRLDLNRDGAISRQEAVGETTLNREWNELDLNDDSLIDQGEFSAFEEEPYNPFYELYF